MRKMLECATGALLLLAVSAQAQEWQGLGPDGGAVWQLLADPAIDGRVYASGPGGLFVSTDAGREWREIGSGLPAGDRNSIPGMAADAERPGRLYLFDRRGRLYRSDDHAEQWTATGYQLPQQASYYSPRGWPIIDIPGSADALVIVPSGGTSYKSTDGGVTFAPFTTPQPNQRGAVTFAFDPANPQRVMMGLGPIGGSITNGPTLLRSADGGVHWSEPQGVAQTGSAGDIVFAGGDKVLMALDGFLYLSFNGGQALVSTGVRAARLALAPAGQPDAIAVAGNYCRRSVDLFVTYKDCGAGLSAGVDPGYQRLAMLRDATSYRLLSSGDRVGVNALAGTVAGWVPSPRGLHAQSMTGLAVSPLDSRIFSGFPNVEKSQPALAGSTDGGVSWQPSLFDQAWRIRTIAIDPTTATAAATTTVYAAGQGLSVSGRPGNSGIYRSQDGGTSWQALNQGLPPAGGAGGVILPLVNALKLDPRSCAQPPASGPCSQGPLNSIFALASGKPYSVIRSDARGDGWVAVGQDLPELLSGSDWSEWVQPVDIEFDADGSTIYLSMTGQYSNTNGIPRVPSIASGVFRSSNRGQNWSARSNGLPLVAGSATTTQDVHAMAAHPRRSGVLWAAATPADGATRIYKTRDGGANWLPSGGELAGCAVRDLQIDMVSSDVIYAVGNARGNGFACVYRSEDGGANWTALQGNLPASQIGELRQDPRDRGRLLLTSNRGVWQAQLSSDKLFADGLD